MTQRIEIIQGDLARQAVDAIVNAANSTLLGGGGVDGAIHRAAGPELLEACRTLEGCPTGSAKITLGFRLPAKFVIHTVGPVWRGGGAGEDEQLAACYRSSLELARSTDCRSIAFPAISCGAFGYPLERAAVVSIAAVRADLDIHDRPALIRWVLFDQIAYDAWQRASATPGLSSASLP